MLETNYSAQINDLLSKFPCDVEIPSDWGDFFSRQGILQPIKNDCRRFARKHMPGKAIFEITSTLPSIDRQQLVHAVYTQDISRGGISFLHVDQLYPGETGRLWLSDRKLPVKVARCCRVNSRCYVVGAILAAGSSSQNRDYPEQAGPRDDEAERRLL